MSNPNEVPNQVSVLQEQIKQLNQEAIDYKNTVLRKLNSLEKDMHRLVAENQRLIQVKNAAYVERDACVGLIAQLALAHGFAVGVVHGNQVVVELPSGQVSWEFEEAEAHLFETLPPYKKSVEDIEVIEKYRRVMNSGILGAATSGDC